VPADGAAPHEYPFGLLLASATVPYALSAHLSAHHPGMARLVSPGVHRLPASLRTEHVPYGQAGGNRLADVERRLRAAWTADAADGRAKGKVVVFCNKRAKVAEVVAGLAERGVPAVALSGDSAARAFGSNRHLAGFLAPVGHGKGKAPADAPTPADADTPHVLVTTSLLSRGLDFAQDVRHVFVLDSPRNMVDFLHRAGRSARAGRAGTVVLFGKVKGRGGDEGRAMKKRVRALKA
jgi:ATP-dependent RNA helicase MRH4